MRLSACLITKGEPSLPAAVASIRPHVDEIVIVGTAQEAGEIARPLADIYETFTDCNDSEGIADFAMARQHSFDLATGDAAIWIDSDDELQGGERLRELVSTMPKGTAFIELPYLYEVDEKGRATCVQTRERIVKPIGAWRWQDPVHEVLVTEMTPVSRGETDAVTIIHRRKGKPDFARNLRILERWTKRDPESSRARFYLGLGYFDAGRFADSARVFEDLLPRDMHPDERAIAAMRLSWIAAREHDAEGAIHWAQVALDARPWAECSFALARAWHVRASETGARSDFEQIAYHARAGLAAPPTQTRLWVNPLDRVAYIHATLNVALAELGDTRGALESVRVALAHMPDDASLRQNELLYEAELAGQSTQAALRDTDRVARKAMALHTKGDIRLDVRDTVAERLGVKMTRPAGCLDIVFACGDAWEAWNPATIERHGIGGSEQAVAHMARELAALGHRVRVYTSVGAGAGHYEGVDWRPTQDMARAAPCDVLVAWRDMRLLEVVPAKVRLAWAHDVVLGGMSEWGAALADRVLALSEWHRECLLQQHPEIRSEQIVVTRNGVLPSMFEACDGLPRYSERAIYSSSPTRGLELHLDWWPRVRAVVPNAELLVAYGFETWEKMASANGDSEALARINALETRLDLMADRGVRMLGRVPPARLYEEMAQAGVWLHPSWDTANDREFYEVSCIGAIEAMASGCRVIATHLGALPETVGDGGVLIDVEPNDEGGAQRWVTEIVAAMAMGPRSRDLMIRGGVPDWEDRNALAKRTRDRFAWSGVAAQWETLMRELLVESGREAA